MKCVLIQTGNKCSATRTTESFPRNRERRIILDVINCIKSENFGINSLIALRLKLLKIQAFQKFHFS